MNNEFLGTSSNSEDASTPKYTYSRTKLGIYMKICNKCCSIDSFNTNAQQQVQVQVQVLFLLNLIFWWIKNSLMT